MDAQIEGQLAKVPRALFAKSRLFARMLSLPQDDKVSSDGTSNDHPLVVEDVKMDNFKLFVRVATSVEVSRTALPDLECSEIADVYDLADKWDMPELCRIIKQSSLAQPTGQESAIQQLYLAVRFLDADDLSGTPWIELAIGVLIRSETPPSEDEVSLVESDVLAAMIGLREKFRDVLMERCIAMDNYFARKEAFTTMREKEPFSCELKEEITHLGDRIDFMPSSGRLGFNFVSMEDMGSD